MNKSSSESEPRIFPYAVLAFAVTLFSVLLRSVGIRRPLLGHFSMYQTANGMMAKFFIADHFTTLFNPQVNVIVNGKPGLLLLAYPLNALIAALLKVSLGGSLDFWGRFQAIAFFAGASILLFQLLSRLLDERQALTGLIFFALSPLTIIYGQSFQNEMATVFFIVAFMNYWTLFLKTEFRPLPFVFCSLSLSAVLITRPNALYLAIPAGFWLIQEARSTGHWAAAIVKSLGVMFTASIIPALWFSHIWILSHSAANIYSTMFAQLAVRSSFVSPLIFSLDFYQQLFDKLSGIVLTPFGFTFLVAGIFCSFKDLKKYSFFLVWALACFASSLLIPRKLIDHDFYHLHFLIPAAPIAATGIVSMLDSFYSQKRLRFALIMLFGILSFFSSMRYAMHPAFKTTEEDKHLLLISREVAQLTDKGKSRLIVQGTHPLLYYADRYGWPFSVHVSKVSDYYTSSNWEKLPQEQWEKRNEAYKDPVTTIQYLRDYEGATHLVVNNPQDFSTNPSLAAFVRSNFTLVKALPGVYELYDLRSSPVKPQS